MDVPPRIGRGAPDTIPGFLLARLALAEDLHGGGRGGDLLALAREKILEVIAIGGERLIVVDAIDEPAIAFYQHHGFRPTPGGPSPVGDEGEHCGRLARNRLALRPVQVAKTCLGDLAPIGKA